MSQEATAQAPTVFHFRLDIDSINPKTSYITIGECPEKAMLEQLTKSLISSQQQAVHRRDEKDTDNNHPLVKHTWVIDRFKWDGKSETLNVSHQRKDGTKMPDEVDVYSDQDTLTWLQAVMYVYPICDAIGQASKGLYYDSMRYDSTGRKEDGLYLQFSREVYTAIAKTHSTRRQVNLLVLTAKISSLEPKQSSSSDEDDSSDDSPSSYEADRSSSPTGSNSQDSGTGASTPPVEREEL